MKHIIHDSCQEQSQIQAPTDMEQTRSFQENNNTHTSTTHSSQTDLQTLLDTIQRLTQKLHQARAEINSLRSQTDKFQ
jgi:molecular chaperone GrpE (heat shock protein)